MIASNNNFTMLSYNSDSSCRNINSFSDPEFIISNTPELSNERSSSISSRSTEEISVPPSYVSFSATKLSEEPNPFEQSFETTREENKQSRSLFVPFQQMQQANNPKKSWTDANSDINFSTVLSNSVTNVNETATKPVTFIKEAGNYYYDKYPRKSSNQSTSSAAQAAKRNRKRTSDLESEEKRKNFLERNRIAALKCRQRKKQWLQNLQTRVEYLAADNEQYHIQTNALREELVNLKMMLLAHKECPIDQQIIRDALSQTIPTAAPVVSQMIPRPN